MVQPASKGLLAQVVRKVQLVNGARKVMLERKVILEFRALKGKLDPLEKED